MKPELRDEVTRILGTVAEQAGYERGLRAALDAVRYDTIECTCEDGMDQCVYHDPRFEGIEEGVKMSERSIERLLEETKGDDDG